MNVYPAHKFLNGLHGLKRDVKRPKTIRAPDGPQRQKRTKTLKKLVKSALKGTRFESVEAVKAKATEVLNQLTEADFQHCIQQWKSRMERCRNRQGEYIESDKVANNNTAGELSALRNFDGRLWRHLRAAANCERGGQESTRDLLASTHPLLRRNVAGAGLDVRLFLRPPDPIKLATYRNF
ncbi:hypothetical protein NQ318_013150 [Aromia moschata]|uniref:Uncharacterized protein n=1 Tax=Aromia moschata TaxID=1265417 RepID=A0AAV8Y0E4_9CUCU|nr:hypothetical protein NQ318_013150 [Aromia moschata]